MQRFGVVGGIICRGQDLLLVENRRRDGRTDWSPPGGIVDDGEEPLEALTREVAEETALEVTSWGQRCYSVEVTFTDREALLSVDVFAAKRWQGDLHVDDPDEVVIGAEFFERKALSAPLTKAPRWVSEPLLAWVARDSLRPPLPFGLESPRYVYRASRLAGGGFTVEAVD